MLSVQLEHLECRRSAKFGSSSHRYIPSSKGKKIVVTLTGVYRLLIIARVYRQHAGPSVCLFLTDRGRSNSVALQQHIHTSISHWLLCVFCLFLFAAFPTSELIDDTIDLYRPIPASSECLYSDGPPFLKHSVACSTTTVTKCQAGLRTLQAFPVFHPTCLCREPSVDPDCNAFRDSLFDHPCMVATQKGIISSF